MELTRRDALAALSAVGVTAGGVGALYAADEEAGDGEGDGESPAGTDAADLDDGERETLVAAARTLYPSEVEGVAAFVERYVDGLVGERPDRIAGIADAVAYLDEYAAAWYDGAFADLDAETRSDALRRMGADEADPVPDGADDERVRYHVVNELLFALYASPTGAELVGLENPQGYPGGTESYARPPPQRDDADGGD